MGQMSGADADELDRLGVRLEQAGRRLATKAPRLRRAINDSPWHGRSADRFRQEFNSVHAKAMSDAARFLDDAHESLARNAQQQRDASALAQHAGTQSVWDRIRRLWPPSWMPPLPHLQLPAWQQWPRLTFPKLSIPRMDISRILKVPYLPPLFWRQPELPAVPMEWLTDILIGIGIVGVAAAPSRPSPAGPLAPDAPRPAAPPAPIEPLVVQGPGKFSQQRLVDVAMSHRGETRATGWDQPGECVKWVQSWVTEAGGPPIPGGDHPFSSLAAVGVQVDQSKLRPGDVFQRASQDSYNGSPHTAIVKSFDSETGKVTLVEGNVIAPGKASSGVYDLSSLQKAGHEVRFYRLGQTP